jgi:hypothetical protein
VGVNWYSHSPRGVLPCLFVFVCVCVCVFVLVRVRVCMCDQETLKREAKGPFWTISACEWMKNE